MANKKIDTTPPTSLEDDALDWWMRYVPSIVKEYKLKQTDMVQMEMLAICYGNFQLAYRELKDNNFVTRYKNGSTQLSQYHAMLHQNMTAYNSICREYGLTPLSNIKINEKKAKTENAETQDSSEIALSKLLFKRA